MNFPKRLAPVFKIAEVMPVPYNAERISFIKSHNYLCLMTYHIYDFNFAKIRISQVQAV